MPKSGLMTITISARLNQHLREIYGMRASPLEVCFEVWRTMWHVTNLENALMPTVMVGNRSTISRHWL